MTNTDIDSDKIKEVKFLLKNNYLSEAFIILNSIELENSYTHFLKSIIYEKLGKLEQAIDEISQAIEIDSTVAIYYSKRGYLFFLLSKVNRGKIFAMFRKNNFYVQHSIKNYQLAIDLEPENIKYLTAFSMNLIEMKEINMAKSYLNRILQLKHDNDSVKFILSVISNENPSFIPNEIIINSFDSQAEHYDEIVKTELNYQIPSIAAQEYLKLKIKHDYNLHILDLGCGTGLCTEQLKKYDIKATFTGIDISLKMLTKSIEKQIFDQLYHLDIFDFLSTSNQYYDLIIAIELLTYIGKLDDLFKIINERLTKGGIFICSIELSKKNTNYVVGHDYKYKYAINYISELSSTYRFKILKKIKLKKEKRHLYILQKENIYSLIENRIKKTDYINQNLAFSPSS